MRRMAYILVVVGLMVTARIVAVSLKTASAKKMQLAGLEQQRLERALADAAKTQEMDAKLQVIQERSATIDTMAQGFGSVMAKMTAEDLAAYVEGTILNGEFATLQSIPEIARALPQTQVSGPKEAGQTNPPKN